MMKKIEIEKYRKAIYIFGLLVLFFVLISFSFFDSKIFDKQIEKNNNAAEVELVSNKETVKILFVGDMMFDRNIRQALQRNNGIVFPQMQNFLNSYDLVIGNLEGPITDNASVSVNAAIGTPQNTIFTFDPNVAAILKEENIKLVNIGNNHILNFGKAGLESTRQYLSQANIDFFGDPADENQRMKIENIKGIKIAFINYNQFIHDSVVDYKQTHQEIEQKTLDDIHKARNLNVDKIIVYTHWGNEYAYGPNDNMVRLAHEFVDEGVDLVIGTHPHVVESKEEYMGKQIYYSLGNFVFDQYFDKRTQQGLLVDVRVNAEKQISFQDFNVTMQRNGQTVLQK